MDFGEALKHVKEGKRITRKGWNGKGLFVVYQKGYPEGIECNKQTAEAWGLQEGELFKCEPYLQINTTDGSHAMWVPSIRDVLAEDWEVCGNIFKGRLKNNMLNFGEALEALKQGKRVTRMVWNFNHNNIHNGCVNVTSYIYYIPSNKYKTCTESAKKEFGDFAPYNAYLAIKNSNGTVSIWTPSVDSCLAEDWIVID